MPRRARLATGGIVYHVLNRRVSRLPLFQKPADYSGFETILAEAYHRTGVRIAMNAASGCGEPRGANFCLDVQPQFAIPYAKPISAGSMDPIHLD